MTREPAEDTLSGEPELIHGEGTIRFSGKRYRFEVFHDGAWRSNRDPLPPDMIERLDAAHRHLKEPTKHPWPEGE